MTRSNAADDSRSKRTASPSTWSVLAPGMAILQVLLIDDEIEHLLPLADVLRRAGLAPMIATSEDEALFDVETSPPDVVVIDAEMAERSVEWQLRVAVSKIPCVLMIRRSAQDAQIGVVSIEKPVDAQQLIRLLTDTHRAACTTT